MQRFKKIVRISIRITIIITTITRIIIRLNQLLQEVVIISLSYQLLVTAITIVAIQFQSFKKPTITTATVVKCRRHPQMKRLLRIPAIPIATTNKKTIIINSIAQF